MMFNNDEMIFFQNNVTRNDRKFRIEIKQCETNNELKNAIYHKGQQVVK